MSRKNDFKAGDRVRFRSWEDMAKEFGTNEAGDIVPDDGWAFVQKMKHLCGTYATIYAFTDDEVLLKDFSAVRDTGCFYSTYMLEKVGLERLSDKAIEIINALHTERLDYSAEYIPLIEARNRLAELEDKLESGLLVELPCKAGDVVYGIGIRDCVAWNIDIDEELCEKVKKTCRERKCKCVGCEYATPEIYEYVCSEIQINQDGVGICVREMGRNRVDDILYKAEDIFIDKAKAEARLKELQKNGK